MEELVLFSGCVTKTEANAVKAWVLLDMIRL